MKKVLMFILLAVTGLLFLNYNDARQPRNAIRAAVILAARDTSATVTLDEGEEYRVDAIKITVRAGSEFALQYLAPCGKYFYTIQYGNEMHIGFRLSLSATDINTKREPRHFPSGKYKVITADYDQPSPTVEFNEGAIIVRLNKNDLNKAPCFRKHTII